MVIMNKILLEKLDGIIIDKYLPDVFEDGQYLEEENVHYIGLKIKVGDKIIKLVKDRNSYYSDLFVDDKVILNKLPTQSLPSSSRRLRL